MNAIDHDFQSSGEHWDWRRDRAAVAVPEQDAIAVYENPRGEIVIRREAHWDEDEDHIIIVTKANAAALARAIFTAAGEEAVRQADLPKDTTAATRQRRYRARHRNNHHQEGELLI